MNNIKPKTEPTLSPKSEQPEDELATPLSSDETICQSTTNEEHQPAIEFNATNGFNQQPTCNSDGSWKAHVVSPPILNTEIIVHNSHNKDNNSTSVDTSTDSDIEIKPPTEDDKKPNENINPEYDYIFCIAAISRTTTNSSKLIAISKIDTNIKVDLKTDGYAADNSSSSSNSTIFHLEEPFLVPRIPRDSFTSLSSSGSSTGILLQQPKSKSKPNNILLSKNVYTYPENLVCQKCNYVYPKVSDNFSLDSKEFINKPQIKPRTVKSKQKRKPKQLNISSNLKKTLSNIKSDTENLIDEETDIKLDDFQNQNIEKLNNEENQLKDPISFDIGNKVLAYWVADKFFYPATIIDVMSSKYKVEFMSDYVIKSVNIEGLVHSAAIKKGCSIAIFDTVSQEYRVGEIVSINEVPNGETTYAIDFESEEVVVPFEKLVLDVDIARSLQDKIVLKNYQRLSLSNVSDGRRVRSSRSTNTKFGNNATTNKKNASSKRKKTNQEISQTIKKRKCLFPQEPDPRDIPSTSTGITEENFDNLFHFISSDSDFDHIREDLTNVNMSQLRSSDIDSEHSSPDKINRIVKSPIDKSKKVFTGLNFVLSYAKYKRMPMTNDSDPGNTDNELPTNGNYFKPDKVYKKYLETLITKNGGTCFRYLNLIPKSRYKHSYIITDTPSQTCNFFLGLSLGVPSYHHKYVEQAVYAKTPFSEFLIKNNVKPIPNGWAVEKKTLIFRSPTTVHSSIFYGFIIYLAFPEEPKNEFFAGILRFCGAIVYTSWKNGVGTPLSRHTVVIVTDENCPSILANAKVPKLSIVWVIQSLICESARPIDGHESYISITDDEQY